MCFTFSFAGEILPMRWCGFFGARNEHGQGGGVGLFLVKLVKVIRVRVKEDLMS